ncbi:lipoyl protein ligase domain-containing protein [Fimbriimonas ginsengisoli]|uniref:Biotin/lipoate A/B protein ligase family protein n=1 Tax=Fimbriimonas ginsengisoli Gsoil 348 TaxID=661478 RepID=A0A068NV92_FIMGI|nr:hypothetical protein [Fimbriimonas ginsengisoli]AIE87448.1 biotin/lipoate A/B protein ligase family protein [Fimbriimonas ginsengisoli Gsoil 348]
MRLSLDPPGDGPANMAADLELLSRAAEGEAGGRIYSWSTVWVTLGRGQEAERTLVDPSRIPWIVRPTGGAAVLHGHDLTVGLAFPLRRSVRDSYRIGTEPLIAALHAGGVPAVLAESIGADDGDPRRIDCFAGSSSNDIVDPRSGAKVCGCALRRTRDAVLIQASIPVRDAGIDPASVIRGGVAIKPVALNRSKFAETLQEGLDNLKKLH